MSQIGKEEYESDMWATYVCDSEQGGKQLTRGLHQSVASFAGLDLGWAVSLVVTKGPFGRALASPKTALALAHEVKPLL
jgi:hypothetical protein